MLLITHNEWFYCFFDKYQGCELDYNKVWRLLPLCQIPIYLNNFGEELDCAKFPISVSCIKKFWLQIDFSTAGMLLH